MDRVSEGKGRCRCSCYLLWGQTNGSTFPFMKMRGPGASFLFMYEDVNNCACIGFLEAPTFDIFLSFCALIWHHFPKRMLHGIPESR